MRRLFTLAIVALVAAVAWAVDFDQYFTDATLRLDYAFAGDVNKQEIYLDQLSQLPRWWGRRTRLDEVPAAGDGTITVRVLQPVPRVDIDRRGQASAQVDGECVLGTDAPRHG